MPSNNRLRVGALLVFKEISCGDIESLVKIGMEVRDLGRTVIFPTDTVYGLGSNPFLEEAVKKCFSLKGREKNKTVPILFSQISTLERYVEFNQVSEKLARAFWPGGLTLVLPVKKGITLPEPIVKDAKMAVRIPDNTCCIELIGACGGSIIGTSANVSGEPPSSDPDDVRLRNFASKCDYFVKGKCTNRIPSTVMLVGSNGSMKILRQGAITERDIISQLGNTSRADLS